MPRDACKEGAPEWAIASAGVAAMKVLIFPTVISKILSIGLVAEM